MFVDTHEDEGPTADEQTRNVPHEASEPTRMQTRRPRYPRARCSSSCSLRFVGPAALLFGRPEREALRVPVQRGEGHALSCCFVPSKSVFFSSWYVSWGQDARAIAG